MEVVRVAARAIICSQESISCLEFREAAAVISGTRLTFADVEIGVTWAVEAS